MIMLESTSRISKGSSFQGNLTTAGKLIVAGKLDGNTKVHGLLQLNSSGYCSGDIEAQVVIVDGRVEGNIYAEHRLEIHSEARVFGNISCPSVTIQEGARVTGHINVGKMTKLTLVENTKRFEDTSVKQNDDKRLVNYG